jgi:Resolvase, N terminal domain
MTRRPVLGPTSGLGSVPRFVAYYRVSTDKQGRSGLGLEAQKEAVARRVQSVAGPIIAEFEEVESGSRRLAMRPIRPGARPQPTLPVHYLSQSVCWMSTLE